MSSIRILPEILSNKIAAGEVVERPASVVKELVENALDAGSTRIVVDIEKGGRSLIRISDNGSGMSPDDALLSIERYATSKIYTHDDLFAIKTLGFRGEALPSIASVSRFSLITRAQGTDAGTEVLIEGGKIKKVSEVGAPFGTMVTVKHLFFNTPARRKFLKQVATEMGHIADVLSSMALGNCRVQFKLLHNGRLIKNWVQAAGPFERVVDILGKDLQHKLYRVTHSDDLLVLDGWVSSPNITRTTSRNIYIFINGRMVKDRVVQHALFDGYAGRIMKGRFPLAVLFLQVPHDTLDVNVHPTKSEVRFAHQKQVHDAIRQAVASTLRQEDALKWGRETYPETPRERVNRAGFHPHREDNAVSGVSEHPAAFQTGMKDRPKIPQRTDASAVLSEKPVGDDADFKRQTGNAVGDTIDGHDADGALPPFHPMKSDTTQPALWGRTGFADLKVIGQFQDVYILCEAGEDLVMIDQHAAHERILYEHLKQLRGSKVESQGLLMPEAMEFGYREAGVLERMLPELQTLGVHIEHFGGDTYVIQSMPAVFKGSDIQPLIRDIVEKWIENRTDASKSIMDDTLKIMACHGAIRANQRLTPQEIKTMLKQLDACEQPSNCPHGRPTWIRLDRRFIEKSFKRIV